CLSVDGATNQSFSSFTANTKPCGPLAGVSAAPTILAMLCSAMSSKAKILPANDPPDLDDLASRNLSFPGSADVIHLGVAISDVCAKFLGILECLVRISAAVSKPEQFREFRIQNSASRSKVHDHSRSP